MRHRLWSIRWEACSREAETSWDSSLHLLCSRFSCSLCSENRQRSRTDPCLNTDQRRPLKIDSCLFLEVSIIFRRFEIMFGTFIVGFVLLAIVSSIIYSMIKSKRAGKSSCGFKCSSCHCNCPSKKPLPPNS